MHDSDGERERDRKEQPKHIQHRVKLYKMLVKRFEIKQIGMHRIYCTVYATIHPIPDRDRRRIDGVWRVSVIVLFVCVCVLAIIYSVRNALFFGGSVNRPFVVDFATNVYICLSPFFQSGFFPMNISLMRGCESI